MATKPLYITTTLPYVNAEPHIGFAVEILQADVLARLAKEQGREVFFNTGTDEHGQKVDEAAKKADEDVHAYVDRHVASVKKLKSMLGLSYDTFIRTTDKHHIDAAQELWKLCDSKGDIEKRKYTGLYCVGCEKFLTQRDLEGGKCPLHPGMEPQEVEEENYFFKLSNYQKKLEEYLSQEGVIVPEYRRQEALEFVKNGLEDFSISREKNKLPWGIPVPGDDSQVMYVWFDALTNYISTLGWPDESGDFKKFWQEGETLQMAGKDQVRFQSIMWQAMLMSAGIKNTDRVFYHGFINSGGQRMSKSLGNVISPTELVERYGTDATRYLLLRHVHPTDDTDVTWERLDEWYTADLVNGIGNLVSRVLKMANSYFDGKVVLKKREVGSKERARLILLSENLEVNYRQSSNVLLKDFEFQNYCAGIWFVVNEADKFITSHEPYNLIKEDAEKTEHVIWELLNSLRYVAGRLRPIMPDTSDEIFRLLGLNADQKHDETVLEFRVKNEQPRLFPRLN